MAAPVLTAAEQKAALSKKKKKRILKNVLGLPKYLKVESKIPEESKAEELKNVLERLLPSARLPISTNFPDKDTTPEETCSKAAAQLKRRQLSLGVNDLNKSIKKGLISAALLASDIEPKFLVHHLNLLCSHNKIPYLHMVGLREITKKCLGFPCIALGFKNNSDFSDAISVIKTISGGFEKNDESAESDADVTDGEEVSANEKTEEVPFTLLYRSSTKERVFVPENHEKDEKADGFIPIDKDADAVVEKKVSGISSHLVKKKPKSEKDSSSEDVLIPRKRAKKDKIGVKQKPKYHPLNLVKVSSNPNRVGRKRKG